MAADSYIWTGNEGEPEMLVLDNLVDDENTTVEQAIQKTIELAQTTKKFPNPLAIHCECTARGVIVAAARTTPERQSRLISYVHELRKTTVTSASTGESLVYDGAALWKDLPTFEYTVADDLHSIPAPRHTPEQLIQWESIIAFFAQLDASTTDPKLHFTSTWAIKYISLALVNPVAKYDYENVLRMACSWFVYDAEKLWRKVPDDPDYSLTNWQQWKHALEEKTLTAENEKTRNLIGAALSEMERVEKT
ncbi:hypothetical protein DE146DRAFT_644142 [Phaeosphaeria sp. MPI-PUGE-AT-0046c]|nr:hypothetical protein DE146DRAFT_644142 [Phaeosphaeria sp. MPI-PUGE-AT-0046c]